MTTAQYHPGTVQFQIRSFSRNRWSGCLPSLFSYVSLKSKFLITPMSSFYDKLISTHKSISLIKCFHNDYTLWLYPNLYLLKRKYETISKAAFTRDQCGSVPSGQDSTWPDGFAWIVLGSIHGRGTILERYSSKLDHFHKWTHLVPDKRTDLEWICQVPYKCNAYPYQFRTGSKQIRSRVKPPKTGI